MLLEKSLLKSLFKLYDDYKKTNILSAAEFIDDIKEKTPLSDSEVHIFFELTKHQEFLQDLLDDFLANKRIKRNNAEIVIFLLIFVIDEENLEEILECCLQIKCFYLCDLVGTIADPNRHLHICEIARRYFDDEYVLEKIIDPLLNKIRTIVQLGRKYLKYYEMEPLPTTKPKGFQFLKGIYRRYPFVPSNTPAIPAKFRASEAPKSTWKISQSVDRRILRSKAANRKRAEQLLLEASQVPERLIKPRNPPENVFDEATEVFKSKPTPVFKSVEIKGNLTTTLREASRIMKSQNKEVKKIDDLMKGGYSRENIEKLEKQLKKENDLKGMETIEKNHIKGLLSHEEAIIAKHRLLDHNKQKMEKFKEDKIELLRALDVWRDEEEQKIRSLVEKSQTIKQNAKQSEQKLLKRKQENVRIQQYETKQMLDQALAEKNKELARKVELIQEIKAIHQVRCNIREFDPTETPNLGLLCEMSIAELQERLTLSKMQMQKELEEKRQGILMRKEKHQLMIENVKKLISETRANKPKVEKVHVKLEDTPDLLELRRQLEEKRKLRSKLL